MDGREKKEVDSQDNACVLLEDYPNDGHSRPPIMDDSWTREKRIETLVGLPLAVKMGHPNFKLKKFEFSHA
ncbi:hypothetical protein KIN20_023674 [Parelaphostrongylus tenuis]|uniref:Uncharacterized protein n=1 Tax=Parelaphostrongylus tenuis TaxID=148309 RepID=A0AAD5QW93_PARTN|nr:hypothetical protein KIN20_023674 [Parelaphostrongylus tenuis]